MSEISVKRCISIDLHGYEPGTDEGINFCAEGRDGLALTAAQAREIAALLNDAADELENGPTKARGMDAPSPSTGPETR